MPLVPNLYTSIPTQKKLTLGFGVFSPFGLGTHWSETGPLRYVTTNSELKLVGFNPTLAFPVNDQVSVGAGIVYARVDANLQSSLNLSALNSFWKKSSSKTGEPTKTNLSLRDVF